MPDKGYSCRSSRKCRPVWIPLSRGITKSSWLHSWCCLCCFLHNQSVLSNSEMSWQRCSLGAVVQMPGEQESISPWVPCCWVDHPGRAPGPRWLFSDFKSNHI